MQEPAIFAYAFLCNGVIPGDQISGGFSGGECEDKYNQGLKTINMGCVMHQLRWGLQGGKGPPVGPKFCAVKKCDAFK